ncbi:hypothetical protein [Couchioplanes azureus]|uniref:hypothetical protein n=1 Tax=Couchioplanes caeruleus TaxID=56438 RepID=UPI00166FE21A|nr:hypothetical protein [Couchioplanes caeruleus]GGQ86348.1 hypothetical protein GCM10010166_65700 [Couchioplanes caeruleus subsp. azureus]
MPTSDEAGEVVVSIQATGMEQEPWAGHRAVGLLATEDLVLVPEAAQELADAGRWFEALIIPTSLGADRPVERISIAGVEALQQVDDGRVTSVVFKLARWSRYPSSISSFSNCDFKQAVREQDGNVWKALLSVGAIRPGLDVVPEELLRAVPAIEREQRQRRIHSHPYRFPGDDSWDICPFILWPCRPCQPCRP